MRDIDLQRVAVPGVELQVQVSGEGPDVLLVHGYPDTHECWRHQVPALNAAGYRTIAPDLRGFGASDKPADLESYHPARHVGDLLALLDHLDVRRAHLVGHDWGSALAQQLTITAPQRVASLSCLSVGHVGAILRAGLEQRRLSWYMLLFQFPEVAAEWLRRDDFRNLREFAATHPDLDAVIERMRDPHALTSAMAIYRTGAPAELLLVPPAELPAVPVPTLGVWSSGDAYLSEASMTGSAEYVTGPWRYVRLDGVGHWMQLEAPEKVNAVLLDFLARP